VNFGDQQTTVFPGLERVGFSYLLGMLLCRLWRARPNLIRVSPLVPVVLLCGILISPAPNVTEFAFDVFAVFVAFPLVLVLGVYSVPHPRWRRMSSLLGTSSYAVYVIHFPALLFFDEAWVKFTGHGVGDQAAVSLPIYLIVVIGGSLLLDRYYDVPVRERLRRLVRGRAER
jgi:peptidoglycan/LPS O-acetylase OafA/YrhL